MKRYRSVNRKIKKYAAFFLCVSMSAGGLSSAAFANEIGADEAELSPFEMLSEDEITPTEDGSKKVRVIIELEDKPLLENRLRIKAYGSAANFLKSNEAERAEDRLAESRESVIKSLEESPLDIDAGDVVYEYSAVLNGVAVEAAEKDLEDIKNIPGVKNAYVEEFHPLIEPEESHIMLENSTELIGSKDVNTLGYTGKNTLTAILDTGFYVGHEAFSGSVDMPKYTSEDIENIIKNKSLSAGDVSLSSAYYSEKIPFVYDYADKDDNVLGPSTHGTHVSGIVGANNGKVRGVAPDTQLALMKIFKDNANGAYDSEIIAGLDDAVKLGADVINMSVGTDGSIASVLPEVFTRVNDAGINLVAAAGNAQSSAYHNKYGNNLPLVDNPDNSIIGAPADYDMAVGVSSMSNTTAKYSYFSVDSRKIPFAESAGENHLSFLREMTGSREYEDCGRGTQEDFSAVDVNGKIALVERGGREDGLFLTYAQLEANAVNAGAAAMIVYNNIDSELISMETDGNIPAVFITMEDGVFMRENAYKQVSVSEENVSDFKNTYSGKMSDSSSWGPSYDLKLKPDITAPGVGIYSSVPGGYSSKSGTSMASPHMAGAGAVLSEYIRSQWGMSGMSQSEIKLLANKLMISTAVPLRDGNGVYYSPRKQGAGLVQVDKAISTKAYLSNADGSLPKGEIGDSSEGSFQIDFDINSLAEEDITYEIQVTVLTENTKEEKEKVFIAQSPKVLDESMVEIIGPERVTAAAGGKSSVSLKAMLTAEARAELESIFPNGIYIEGFVSLKPLNEGNAVLSYPFLGFFGSWAEVPMFDSDVFDDDDPVMNEIMLGFFKNDSGSGYYLGHNAYVEEKKEIYSKDKIAVRGDQNDRNVSAEVSLLRSVEELRFTAENSEGEIVYSESKTDVTKNYYEYGEKHTVTAKKGWITVDENGEALPDGEYVYKVTGLIGGKGQTIEFPVIIDTQKPQIIESKVYGDLWCVRVQDNHFIQAIMVRDAENNQILPISEPEANSAGEVITLVFDLSTDQFAGLEQAKISLTDFARNVYNSELYSLEDSGEPLPNDLKPYDPDEKELQLSVNSPENAQPGEELPFTLSLENAERVKSVTIEIEKDGGLDLVNLETKNGFSCSLTEWDEENPNKGKIVLEYAKEGSKEGFTSEELTDAAELIFETSAKVGKFGVKVTGLTVTGYNKDGRLVYLNSNIQKDSAETVVEKVINYDLNGDGAVNSEDIAFCVKYYQMTIKNPDWDKYSQCDLDENGIINIVDFVMLAAAVGGK